MTEAHCWITGLLTPLPGITCPTAPLLILFDKRNVLSAVDFSRSLLPLTKTTSAAYPFTGIRYISVAVNQRNQRRQRRSLVRMVVTIVAITDRLGAGFSIAASSETLGSHYGR